MFTSAYLYELLYDPQNLFELFRSVDPAYGIGVIAGSPMAPIEYFLYCHYWDNFIIDPKPIVSDWLISIETYEGSVRIATPSYIRAFLRELRYLMHVDPREDGLYCADECVQALRKALGYKVEPFPYSLPFYDGLKGWTPLPELSGWTYYGVKEETRITNDSSIRDCLLTLSNGSRPKTIEFQVDLDQPLHNGFRHNISKKIIKAGRGETRQGYCAYTIEFQGASLVFPWQYEIRDFAKTLEDSIELVPY